MIIINHIKTIKTTALIATCSFLLATVLLMVWFTDSPSLLSAQTTYSTLSCEFKINKENCEAAVRKECTSTIPDRLDECKKSTIGRFKDGNRNDTCASKINQQNCETAVTKECNSLSPDRREDCRRNTISRFKDKEGQGPSQVTSGGSVSSFFGGNTGTHTCGEGEAAIKTKFNFGCSGKGNPIFDVLFAIIRFLTFGVGIAVVIAIILAGIKYTTSEGNPETTMAAKNQIQNAIIALIIYLFAFALLNFLIPGGLLR